MSKSSASKTPAFVRPRLVDVAARAGVAPNTASTILNNRSNSWASAETRERVFAAARELGYSPSRAALGIRLGKFKSVGLVLADLHNPYYTSFAHHFETALQTQGYDLIIEHSRCTLEHERRSYQTILARQVDGAAFHVTDVEFHREFLEGLAQRHYPAVAMAAKSEHPLPVDSVVIDFSAGLAQAVDHLIGLGHRRWAFLCALAEGQDDGGRPAIFRNLLTTRGVAAEDVHFVRCGHEIGSARRAMADLLQRSRAQRPTALLALNDLSAIGAMRAAVDAGLRLPRDLSVIGVDNIPLGEHLSVALSTIAQPIADMAGRAAEILVKRIDGSRTAKPRQIVFPTQLLLRESTAPAPR